MLTDNAASANRIFVGTKKSILDDELLLQAIQKEYDLPPTIDLVLHRVSGSDVYRVTDRGDSWFLKVYSGMKRDTKRAFASIAALHVLSQRGFSVPHPVANRHGALVTELQAVEGRRIAFMYPAALGNEPLETDPDHAYAFGATAARMHQIMDGVPPRTEFRIVDYDYLFERYIHGVERFLGQEVPSICFLRELAKHLWQALERLLCSGAPLFGFCHGDMHTGNAILTDSGEIVLFDFDACGYSWRVMDIGTYYVSYDWMQLSDEARRKREKVISDFLRGYNLVRQITEAEMKALDLFLAIRHFELLGLAMDRVQFSGTHWVNSDQLASDVGWFRRWLSDYCEWFAKDHPLIE